MIRPQRWIAVVLLSLIAFQIGYQRDYLRDSWASAFGSGSSEKSAENLAAPATPSETQTPAPITPGGLGQPVIPGNPVAQPIQAPVVQPNLAPPPPVSPFAARSPMPNAQQDSLTRSLDVITPTSDTNTGPNNASNPYFDKLSEQLQQLKEQSQVTEFPNPNAPEAAIAPDEEEEDDLDLEEDEELSDDEDDTELSEDEDTEEDDADVAEDDMEDLADLEQDSDDTAVAP